jgi:hypothetical protein
MGMLAQCARKWNKNKKSHVYIPYFHLQKDAAFLLAPGIKFPRFGTEHTTTMMDG